MMFMPSSNVLLLPDFTVAWIRPTSCLVSTASVIYCHHDVSTWPTLTEKKYSNLNFNLSMPQQCYTNYADAEKATVKKPLKPTTLCSAHW